MAAHDSIKSQFSQSAEGSDAFAEAANEMSAEATSGVSLLNTLVNRPAVNPAALQPDPTAQSTMTDKQAQAADKLSSLYKNGITVGGPALTAGAASKKEGIGRLEAAAGAAQKFEQQTIKLRQQAGFDQPAAAGPGNKVAGLAMSQGMNVAFAAAAGFAANMAMPGTGPIVTAGLAALGTAGDIAKIAVEGRGLGMNSGSSSFTSAASTNSKGEPARGAYVASSSASALTSAAVQMPMDAGFKRTPMVESLDLGRVGTTGMSLAGIASIPPEKTPGFSAIKGIGENAVAALEAKGVEADGISFGKGPKAPLPVVPTSLKAGPVFA